MSKAHSGGSQNFLIKHPENTKELSEVLWAINVNAIQKYCGPVMINEISNRTGYNETRPKALAGIYEC